ncbi:MAG: hypothetical protein M1830_005506 [Pleopsidium flavum]|nr:MAG: hypothetical protein M1830_005506 [Pleopsidium flavum]
MEDQPKRIKHEQELDRAYYAHLPYVLASSSALQTNLDIYNAKPYALPPLPPPSSASTIVTDGNNGTAQFPKTPTFPNRHLKLYDRLHHWSTLLPHSSTITPLRALTFHDITPNMRNPDMQQSLLLAHFELGVERVTELSVRTVGIPAEDVVVDGCDVEMGEGEEEEEAVRKDSEGVEWIWVVIRWGGSGTEAEKEGGQGKKMVCFAIPECGIVSTGEKNTNENQTIAGGDGDLTLSRGGIPIFDSADEGETFEEDTRWWRVEEAMARGFCRVRFLT